MPDERTIGVFDSGLGGLSVMRNLLEILPDESFLYFADSAWCPYGNRSVGEIAERSVKITEYLLGKGAKLIVVACNTATAAAIDILRSNYHVPFIGIEPAVKQAALHTSSGKVGVLATQNTFQGRLFRETSAKFAAGKDVLIQVMEGLVEVVEEDKIDTPEAVQLLTGYIRPMVEAGVDQIVLGCTHYPFLIPAIRNIVPVNVVIHDPSPAVAKQTAHILKEYKLESSGSKVNHKAVTTGNEKVLKNFINKIGLNIPDCEKIAL